jgi:hypothetical protein
MTGEKRPKGGGRSSSCLGRVRIKLERALVRLEYSLEERNPAKEDQKTRRNSKGKEEVLDFSFQKRERSFFSVDSLTFLTKVDLH